MAKKITWAGTMSVFNQFTPESVDEYFKMADDRGATFADVVLFAERVANGSVPSNTLKLKEQS